MFAQVDGKTLTEELEKYHKGYMHAVDDVRKIKPRNRDVDIQKKGGDSTGETDVPKGGLDPDQPSGSHTGPGKEDDKRKGPMALINVGKESSNVKILEPVATVEPSKTFPTFDLQNELAKLKISIPFNNC